MNTRKSRPHRELVLAPALLLFLAGASVMGCDRADSAEDRQIAQLQQSIGSIQSDNERFEQRITENDRAMNDAHDTPRPTQAKTAELPKTPPPTVQVGDSSEEEPSAADDPDDSTPRPVIKISGYASRMTRKGAHGQGADDTTTALSDDANDPAPATTGNAALTLRGANAVASRPSALDPDAKPAYDAALALVNRKQYAQALDAFAAFLVKWPDHPNADNAMYWRGESYFALGDVPHAAEQFEGIVARFPMGNKVPDALLKLGLCQQKLGNPQKARSYFDQLAHEYPRSEAARKIPSEGSTPKREDKK